MKKNCLNCEYEPGWGEWSKGKYSRCSGACRWDGVIPTLPAIMIVSEKHIVRYSDDSGIPSGCKTWKQKPSREAG